MDIFLFILIIGYNIQQTVCISAVRRIVQETTFIQINLSKIMTIQFSNEGLLIVKCRILNLQSPNQMSSAIIQIYFVVVIEPWERAKRATKKVFCRWIRKKNLIHFSVNVVQ